MTKDASGGGEDTSGSEIVKSPGDGETATETESGTESPPNADVEWFLSQHAQMKSEHFAGKFGVRDNPAGWWEGWYLRAYVDMYEATRDVRILRRLNELLKIVHDGNDLKTGFKDEGLDRVVPGWGGLYRDSYGPYGGARYSDHTLNGLYMYPLATFARIVKEDKKLQAEFGADADAYLELVEKIFDVFSAGSGGSGPYSDGTYGIYDVYPTYYYETYNGKQEYYGGTAKPINMTLVPAEAYAEAYRASKKQKFATYAAGVANYLWWNMSYDSKDGITWMYWTYWPAALPGYTKYKEDASHGALSAKFAVTMRHSGIANPFAESARLQYLANTFKYSIMTSSTKMRWRMNDPDSEEISAADSYLCADWTGLTPYDKNSGSSVHTWCDNIMKAAGLNPKDYLPVFAAMYRNDPNRR